MAEVKDLVVQTLDVSKLSVKEYINGLLQDIETQVKSYVFDPKTPDGRADIISLAYKVSQSKTHIVKVSDKDMESKKKEIKDRTGIINYVKEFLDNLRDETRKPVTDWENEQKKIADEEEARQREIIEGRVKSLMAIEVIMPLMEVATLTDDEFQCLLDDKTFEFEERQKEKAIAKAAEEKRKAEEAEKIRLENERLANQKKEQDAKEAELKKQQDKLAAQQKAIDDEKDRIAKEKQDKIDAENTRIKAEQDRTDKEALEAKEAEERKLAPIETEKKAEALRPDVDKLKYWLDSVENVFDESPEMSTEDGREIKRHIVNFFDEFMLCARGYL